MRSSRLTIPYSHEFADLTLSASVSPGSPEVRDVESPFCGPATGPEVDDVRLVLTREQARGVQKAVNDYMLHDSDPAALALDILRALDPEFATGDDVDAKFCEAMDERPEYQED